MILTLAVAAAMTPSFESAVEQVRLTARQTRSAQLAAKDAALGARLDRAAAQVQRHGLDASNLRRELSTLRLRLERGDASPDLNWQVTRVGQDLERHVNGLLETLQDARILRREMTGKDPALAAPARRFDAQVRRLASEELWMESESRWMGSDLRRAGFSAEAFYYEQGLRDAAARSRALEDEARAILAKVQ